MTAFLMLLILTPLSLQAQNDQARRHFEKGVAHFEKQKVKRALKQFEKAIRKDADWAEPHYYAGRCKLLKGELSEAQAHFEKALVLDPTHEESSLWLSISGDWVKLRKAAQFLREARLSEACTELETFLKEGGDLEQAVQILALPFNGRARSARVIGPLFEEFVKRRQWENALGVAAVWEHTITPDSRIGIDAAKNGLRSQLGYVYLQQGESAKADRMHEEIMQHMSAKSPNVCDLNQKFLAHYGHRIESPSVVHQVRPSYTDEAIRANVQGSILLGGVVEADGSLTHIQVLDGLGYGLDEKALTTMQEFRFEPGQLDGQPIPCMINMEFTFTLINDPTQGDAAT